MSAHLRIQALMLYLRNLDRPVNLAPRSLNESDPPDFPRLTRAIHGPRPYGYAIGPSNSAVLRNCQGQPRCNPNSSPETETHVLTPSIISQFVDLSPYLFFATRIKSNVNISPASRISRVFPSNCQFMALRPSNDLLCYRPIQWATICAPFHTGR